MTLPILASCLVIFALVVYVLLDGFDLGVGALLLTRGEESERDTMVGSISPVWDGNETWLVLLAISLFAMFPLAYATLLPAFYLPVFVMLMAMGFRGVSFEFRMQATRDRARWDVAFSLGSIVAAACQGLIIGTLVKGLPIENGTYMGGAFGFISWFSGLTAVLVVLAYVVLGAAWLNMRADTSHRARTIRQLRSTLVVFAAAVVLMSLVAFSTIDQVAAVWRTNAGVSGVFLALALLSGAVCWKLAARAPGWANLHASAMVAMLLLGLVFGLWPYLVPYEITIWMASSPSNSQQFALTGAAVMVPLILANAVYVYWKFRRFPRGLEIGS